MAPSAIEDGDDGVISELRHLPASLDTRQVAEVLNIVNQAEVSGRLSADQWPGFRVGVQWRMRRSVVQRIMLGLDPWEGQRRPNQPHGQQKMATSDDRHPDAPGRTV